MVKHTQTIRRQNALITCFGTWKNTVIRHLNFKKSKERNLNFTITRRRYREKRLVPTYLVIHKILNKKHASMLIIQQTQIGVSKSITVQICLNIGQITFKLKNNSRSVIIFWPASFFFGTDPQWKQGIISRIYVTCYCVWFNAVC